jgi:hypothetical protein
VGPSCLEVNRVQLLGFLPQLEIHRVKPPDLARGLCQRRNSTEFLRTTQFMVTKARDLTSVSSPEAATLDGGVWTNLHLII